MVRIFVQVKNFISFLFLLLVLAALLVAYSLYEEKSYYESCQDLGVQCSKGRMHELVESVSQKFPWK